MMLDDNGRALRAALGRFPTGVAIATTHCYGGRYRETAPRAIAS